MLRHARRITLYDRQIGEALQDFARRTGSRPAVRDAYSITIEWVMRTYLRSGGIGPIQIVTGVNRDRPYFQEAADAVQAFATGLSIRLGRNVELILVAETADDRLRHERFLLTDQTTLQIGRGYDLLHTDGDMRASGLDPIRDPRPVRDVVVARLTNRGNIEREYLAMEQVT